MMRGRTGERGQAVIEMALTLPLLLLVVFGIFDFGFMFQKYEVVTNAAREGARLGVLTSSAGYTTAEAQNRAFDYLSAGGVTSSLGDLTSCPTSRAIDPGRRCAQLTTSTVTVAGSSPAKTVDQVMMVVEYDYEYAFVGPIMGLFGGNLGTVRLRAVSTMRKE
jgi:Flp pilus assembly protein TadG